MDNLNLLAQKYKDGDLVMIAKDLGIGMSHFDNDCEAIVMYTYASKYWGNDNKSYGLYIKGKGETAWYKEHQITLIEPNRGDLLLKWKEEAKAISDEKSNLDWIFSNGVEVLKKPHSATIQALASMLGCDNLWGSNGEGFVWQRNAMATISHAHSFLLSGDKLGWEKYCEKYLQSKGDKS